MISLEIINTIQDGSGYNLEYLIPLILGFFGFIAGIAILIISYNLDLGDKVALFIFISSSLFLVFVGIYNLEYDTPQPKHEVIIHDINEYDYEKYEIVEQQGRKFIVKEK